MFADSAIKLFSVLEMSMKSKLLALLIVAVSIFSGRIAFAASTDIKACDKASPSTFVEISSQPATNTVNAEGYQITYGRDLYVSNPGEIVGSKSNCITISNGSALEAYVVGSPAHASPLVVIERNDHQAFDLTQVVFESAINILTGGLAIEIMPILADGEDGLPDPFVFNITKYQPAGLVVDIPASAGVGFYKYKMSGFFTGVKAFTVNHPSQTKSESKLSGGNAVKPENDAEE